MWVGRWVGRGCEHGGYAHAPPGAAWAEAELGPQDLAVEIEEIACHATPRHRVCVYVSIMSNVALATARPIFVGRRPLLR